MLQSESKTESKETTPLKTMMSSETKIESQVSIEGILADNQIRYVLPRAVSTVNQRHYIRQYAQRSTYGPGDQITFILNSADLFWNGMNSYLTFQCGLDASASPNSISLSLPTFDARLGSAGALSLINRIIITSASGTECVNINYANAFYQKNLHYNYCEEYLKTTGSTMGIRDVPTLRSYGVNISPGAAYTTTTPISPCGYMYNPLINPHSSSAGGTTTMPVTTSIAYSVGSTATTSVGTATIVSSTNQGSFPFTPSTYGVTSQFMAGSIVTYDPSQSYYGMNCVLPQAQTAVNDSTTFCGCIQDTLGTAAAVATTSVSLQSGYTIDTALKRRYVGNSIVYQSTSTITTAQGIGGVKRTSPTFVIPLHQLSGLFATDKLIVPTLGASLRIDIFLEQTDIALQFSGAIPATLAGRNYTINNPTIMLDTLMMNDKTSEKIFEISSKVGLDFDYSDVNNTTTTFSAGGDQTLDNKIAVSRAENAFVITRDTIALTPGTTAALFDSMCSTLLPPYTQYQFNLGGLYLPQDNLKTLEEQYFNALYCFNKLDLNGKPMFSNVSFQDFLCGGYNLIACNLERSSLIKLTGIPVSSSRTLTARLTIGTTIPSSSSSLPYLTNPLGGTGGPSTSTSAQRADMYLIYRALLKIFPTKIVKRI